MLFGQRWKDCGAGKPVASRRTNSHPFWEHQALTEGVNIGKHFCSILLELVGEIKREEEKRDNT